MTSFSASIQRRSLQILFGLLFFATTAASQAPGQEVKNDSAIIGLDHVVIAVNDLEAAASQFQKLGFALKPGRPHANGIRNQHIKFPDGTEIELLTAPEARDSLAAQYREHSPMATVRHSSLIIRRKWRRLRNDSASRESFIIEVVVSSLFLPAIGSGIFSLASGITHPPTGRNTSSIRTRQHLSLPCGSPVMISRRN